MAHPVKVQISHQLGRAEARRRIDAGFGNLVRQLPGSAAACSQQWHGDRLTFRVAALGQALAGVIDVLDAAVTIEIELPGLLGTIAGALEGRLRKAGQLLLNKD